VNMTHLPQVPNATLDEIKEAMKQPEATVDFRCMFESLFDPHAGRGILMQVVTGEIIIRLERDSKLDLNFYYSSPGTGTRAARINLEPLVGSSELNVMLMWSRKEIGLQVADADNASKFATATGTDSDRQFRVGTDGSVMQVGGKGVEVKELRMNEGGRVILQPTAIESWRFTVEGVRILFSGSSPKGYIFENVATNMAIVMLMTGLETYCGRRFLELENEGNQPNYDALVSEFLSRSERDRGDPATIIQEAEHTHVSPIALLKQKKIDFGNWDNCKSAYNKGYGIRFGQDLGVANETLLEVQRLIHYRHRIVHVSPLIGMLNQDRVPSEKPVFANRTCGESAVKTTSEFIEKLHEATLRLRSAG
jgi:hypothetical protein